MSASTFQSHALACPAYRNNELWRCLCGVQGAEDARAAKQLRDFRRIEVMAAMAAEALAPEERETESDDKFSERLAGAIAWMLARPIGLTHRPRFRHDGPASLIMIQRCRACGSEIASAFVEAETEILTIERAGVLARKAWLVHECERSERGLAGFEPEELEEMRQSLEREMVRIGTRIAAIEKRIRP